MAVKCRAGQDKVAIIRGEEEVDVKWRAGEGGLVT
jgi:hypothetical protein